MRMRPWATIIFIAGTAPVCAQPPGSCGLQFAGEEYVHALDSQSLRPSAITIELWVKPAHTDYGHLIAKPYGRGTGNSYVLWIRPGNGNLAWQAGVSSQFLEIANPLVPGVWTHLAATQNASTRQLFVDGQLVASGGGDSIPYDSSPVYLAVDSNFGALGGFLSGELDEVRVWDHVRTAQQIGQHRNQLLSGTEPGLLAYWQVSGGAGQFVVDHSGNGNHGVLGAGPIPDPADPAWNCSCYANCDGSNVPPLLNIADFSCFLFRFAASDPWANCDASTAAPVLNVADFTCFLQRYAAGCP